MGDKTCLITGANSGLGKATAMNLAKKNFQIIMVSRDKNRGEEAKKEIILRTRNKKIDLMIADLSSLKSIRKLAKDVNSKYKKLDILINNAGLFLSKLKLTEDKIENQFQVNYLSPFLLTNLLLPRLKKSKEARIINVASRAHKRVNGINFKDLYFQKNYEGLKAYSQSKLAVVMSTFYLAEKLKSQKSNITVNCLHPGGIKSKIGSKSSSGFYNLLWKIINPFLPSPEKASESIVYLATSNKLKNTTGKYFVKTKIKNSSKYSQNKSEQKKLWELSEKLVGLRKQ